MSEYDGDILKFGARGYCCSQIMILLTLEIQGEDNPGLVRAMQGLCKGAGSLKGNCGVLSGGQTIFAYYLGKGSDRETADKNLPVLQEKYFNWFTDRLADSGGITCGQIAPDPSDRLSVCPALIGESLEKIFSLLVEAGVELDQVKE